MAEPMTKEKSAPAAEPKPKKSVSVADIMGGEKPKAEAKPKVASKAKGKHKHTHIEHHDNGTHTVRHSGEGNEVSYAAPDMAGVHAGLDQHVGGAAAPMPDQSAAQPPDAGAMPGAPPQAPPAAAVSAPRMA